MARKKTSRRRFLTQSSAAGAALAAVPYWSTTATARPIAANDRFVIGCIGVGGTGTWDAQDHGRFGDVVSVCDVDADHRERARISDRIGKGKAESVEDYRRLLDRKDVEVVSIVTPDHWHTKIAIEALQAGKHVFCQKPLTLTLEENLLIRAACKAHPHLTFCVGTQQRSSRRLFMRAVNMARKGLLGTLKKITCEINGAPTGGPFARSAPPANLNWDLWLGQAAKVEYIPQRCHNDFRWWYEYSGGKVTDWGAHHVDIALWAAGLTAAGTGPVEVDGSDCHHPVEFRDGNPLVDDRFNAATDFNIVHSFADGLEIHVSSRSKSNGVLIEGTKGRIYVNRERITGKPIEEQWDKDSWGEADAVGLYNGKPHEGHKDNFYRCIREGGLPVSDVYSHLQTMIVCHLSVIAGRLQRKIRWNPTMERIEGDPLAAAMQARMPRAGFEIPRLGATVD